jgi:hypothetical protein
VLSNMLGTFSLLQRTLWKQEI